MDVPLGLPQLEAQAEVPALHGHGGLGGGGGGGGFLEERDLRRRGQSSVGECGGDGGRGALEGKGPQRRPQRRLGRRLEEVAEAVGGGYCRLQMPLRPALAVRGTVAGQRLGALGGGGGTSPLPTHWKGRDLRGGPRGG